METTPIVTVVQSELLEVGSTVAAMLCCWTIADAYSANEAGPSHCIFTGLCVLHHAIEVLLCLLYITSGELLRHYIFVAELSQSSPNLAPFSNYSIISVFLHKWLGWGCRWRFSQCFSNPGLTIGVILTCVVSKTHSTPNDTYEQMMLLIAFKLLSLPSTNISQSVSL